jgi:hypothetical protein
MHVGSVAEAVKLNSADGQPITGLNPLPTTGGGGGGGSALADVLLTDNTGALFVSRDNGTTVTYFNLNTNAVYTPVGTISAVLGLTNTQLRATAVPVAVSGVTGELIEAIEALRMTVGSLSRTIGLSIPDLLGRQRVSIDVISAGLTLGTITTVGTVSNQTQIGGFVAADQIPALMHMSADNIRANIKVT